MAPLVPLKMITDQSGLLRNPILRSDFQILHLGMVSIFLKMKNN